MTPFLLRTFELEDFFVQYEHQKGLVNLASSDALPWTLREITTLCPTAATALDSLTLGYPNLEELAPSLAVRFGKPPALGVLPTSGTAEAIFIALAGLAGEKNRPLRIALPRPSYGAFLGISELLGCHVSTYDYEASRNWAPDIERLLTLCETCDVVVVNNPHNPTGHLLPQSIARQLHDGVRQGGGVLLVDEVFRLDSDLPSAAVSFDNVVVIGSLSKVYGFPGLRLGWIVASPSRLSRFRTLQQYTTLSPNSFAVSLGRVILTNLELFSRRELLDTNRRVLNEWSSKHASLVRVAPQAGTTAVMEVTPAASEAAIFEAFLNQGVLVVPGSRCFDVSSGTVWFRLGYGGSEQQLHRGLSAIVSALESIGG